MAKNVAPNRNLPQELTDSCFAKAVADGDIVNLRFLFSPFSPLRPESLEDVNTPKYNYLRPENTSSVLYKNALDLVSSAEMRAHVKAQYDKKGPAQLPAPMLVMLADNAVRHGKYSSAAQAYELLRIRRRMREEYLDVADEALDAGDIKTGVRGYIIGAGLDYDYASFPEPLPLVPDYQAKALTLHADYPQRIEDSVALQAPEQHLRTALDYLLIDAELSARLAERPFEVRVAFLGELVRQRDAGWQDFVKRYREACDHVLEFGKRLERAKVEKGKESLAQQVEDTQSEGDPREISACLLGRTIENGAWWQYLKELAYVHPAAALFVARQQITPDLEIIMPRYVNGSPLVSELGLAN